MGKRSAFGCEKKKRAYKMNLAMMDADTDDVVKEEEKGKRTQTRRKYKSIEEKEKRQCRERKLVPARTTNRRVL